jgi:branched-chain amino acid transport system substrate-binding protein
MRGARVVRFDHFQQADPSIAAQITRIKSTRPAPDFLVLCSHPPGAITALRQIRAAGVDLPIVGEGQSFDGEFWKASVPGLSNFYFASNGSISGDDPRPLVNSILRRLNARFGTKASGSTFLTGYSAVQAFAIAARIAKSVDGPKIQQALDRFRNVALVNGPTTFTRDLHISVKRRVALLEVQDGKTKFMRFWTPRSVPPLKAWVSG